MKTRIDYGQNPLGWFKAPEEWIDTATGKPVVFRSAIDALNHMSALGWELVQSYETTEASNYLRFLLRRKERIIR